MNMWQNLNKDENGFLHIELLILKTIKIYSGNTAKIYCDKSCG